MKKYIITAMLAFLATSTISAQTSNPKRGVQVVHIKMKDGTVRTFRLDDLKIYIQKSK